MKTEVERLNAQIANLEHGLVLAEDCLSSISKDSYNILTKYEHDLDNVDIYNHVYRINQKAHSALMPIQNYCLNHVKHS